MLARIAQMLAMVVDLHGKLVSDGIAARCPLPRFNTTLSLQLRSVFRIIWSLSWFLRGMLPPSFSLRSHLSPLDFTLWLRSFRRSRLSVCTKSCVAVVRGRSTGHGGLRASGVFPFKTNDPAYCVSCAPVSAAVTRGARRRHPRRRRAFPSSLAPLP